MTRDAPIDRGRALAPLKHASAAVTNGLGQIASRFQEERPLEADVLESQDAFELVFDAPGATVSDVQVWYEDGAIEVRVDRFRTHEEGYELRFPGRGLSLAGRAALPRDVDVDLEGTSARLRDDGTLHVRVPKDETGDDGDD
ncbi:MAG: Hsp20/alpha crystallin family protein [Halanaeroarchaeum sp.]